MDHNENSAEAERLCNEGYALLEAGQVVEAGAALTQARALAPDNPLVHYRLAMLFSDTARPAEAIEALDVAIRLDPDNARAHNNRGSALQLVGRIAEAEAAFRTAVALAPQLEIPYVNLGKLLELRGKVDEAVVIYRQAIAQGIEAPAFQHYLAAATGQVTERAPASWVRETFDNFAPVFDERLRELQYNAPRQLASLIRSHRTGPLDILDLGCGTGQCGSALAPMKRRIVGVDLSEKMLAKARQLEIYDQLLAVDMSEWLSNTAKESFDLVIAGDVFVYVGALDAIFRDVARIVRSGGLFAFSTEEINGVDYKLLASGRYAQSEAYIGRLGQPSFDILVGSPTVIRLESGTPLAGRLFLLQRK